MPNCAAAPKIISFGLDKQRPEIDHRADADEQHQWEQLVRDAGVIQDVQNAALHRTSPASTAPDSGRLTRIAPKPIGRSSAGSISFLIAR